MANIVAASSRPLMERVFRMGMFISPWRLIGEDGERGISRRQRAAGH
jgi:hypothetical protein